MGPKYYREVGPTHISLTRVVPTPIKAPRWAPWWGLHSNIAPTWLLPPPLYIYIYMLIFPFKGISRGVTWGKSLLSNLDNLTWRVLCKRHTNLRLFDLKHLGPSWCFKLIEFTSSSLAWRKLTSSYRRCPIGLKWTFSWSNNWLPFISHCMPVTCNQFVTVTIKWKCEFYWWINSTTKLRLTLRSVTSLHLRVDLSFGFHFHSLRMKSIAELESNISMVDLSHGSSDCEESCWINLFECVALSCQYNCHETLKDQYPHFCQLLDLLAMVPIFTTDFLSFYNLLFYRLFYRQSFISVIIYTTLWVMISFLFVCMHIWMHACMFSPIKHTTLN